MASINSLANETLHEILESVQPEDLENFAQTSRQINLVSQSYLKPHRELIRKHRSLHLRGRHYKIPDVLREILLNPTIGRYVRSLEIGTRAVYRDYEIFRTPRGPMEDWQYIFDLCRSLWDVFIKSDPREGPDLPFPSLEETSLMWAVYNGELLMPALLLPLLPNLSNLSIIWNTGSYGSLPFARYVTRSAFSHLTSVRLVSPDNFNIPLQDLNLFSAIPSLRLLEAEKTSLRGWEEKRDLSHHKSNVTKLELSSSAVGSGTLQKWLHSFHKLQVFHFSFLNHRHEDDTDTVFNPGSIRAALISQAKMSLQELTLLCEDERISRYENHRLSNMGSLQDFEALVDIFIDWSMLCPKSSDPSTHLHYCLQANIRRLRIREDRTRKDRRRNSLQHEAMLAALRASKSTQLTHLEYVQIVFPYHNHRTKYPPFRTGKGIVEECHDEQYWKDSFEQVGILLDLCWRGPSPCLPELHGGLIVS